MFCSMEIELIADGVLAQDINQASTVWRLREVDILRTRLNSSS